MENWKTTVQDLASRSHIKNLEKIIEALDKIMEKASDPPLFNGTLHCEVILATLMNLGGSRTPIISNEVIQKASVCPLIASNLSTFV